MNDKKYGTAPSHTQAWIFQTWLSFIVSISATSLGVIYLPVDPWLFWFLCGNEVYTDTFFRKIALKVLPDKHFTIP
jgi:hypothetical protein